MGEEAVVGVGVGDPVHFGNVRFAFVNEVDELTENCAVCEVFEVFNIELCESKEYL